MASTNYIITINTTGAINSVTNLQNSLLNLNSTATRLGAVLGAMVGADSIKGLVTLMDAATNLQNRLQTVVVAGQTSKDVLNLMAKSAMDLGVNLNDLGSSYASIANATKDLGYSQQTNIMLNDTLTKSLLLNGATQQQVNSAYYQFGQIMAKGKSEGDDFNSMLEAAPGIIRAMSDQLGVTTGALRYMSSQGKLTAEVWKNAMEKSSESIDKAFKERIPTISQSMERLKNAFEIKVTSLDQATGASQALSLALVKIANVVLDVIDWFQKWGSVLSTIAEVFLIGKVYRALVLLGTPVIALAGRFSALMTTMGGFSGALTYIYNVFIAWLTPVMNVSGFFGRIVTFVQMLVQTYLPNAVAWVNALVKAAAGIGAVLGVDKLFGAIGDLFGEPKEKAKEYSSELDKLNQRLGIGTVEANDKAAEASNKKTERDLKNAAALKKSLEDLQQSYKSATGEFQNSIDAIGATRNSTEMMDAQRKATDEYTNSVKKLKEEFEKNGASGTQAETDAVKKLSDEYGNQLNTLQQLNVEKQGANNVQIAKDALRELSKTYEDYARTTQNAIGSIGLGEQAANFYEGQKQAAEQYYSAVRAMQEEFRQNGTAGSEAEKQAIDKLTESYNKQVETMRVLAAQKEAAVRAQNLLNYSITESISANEKLADIQDQIAQVGMTKLEKQYSDIDIAARKSAEAAIKAEQARRGELDASGKAFKALNPSEVKAYYEAATKGSAKLREEMKKLYEETRTFSSGWKEAFNEYVDNATNAANTAKTLFADFTNGLEDALVNLVKTGKFTWKDFVQSMAEDLLRSQIKQTLSGIIGLLTGQGTGGMSGGILGAIGSLFGLGSGTAGATGKSANDPVYVYAVNGGGSIGSLIGSGNNNKSFGVLQSDQNGSSDGMINGIGKMVGGAVGSVFGPIGTAVGSTIGGFASDIVDGVSSAVEAIGDFFGGLFANGGTLPAGKWGIAGEAGMELVKQANGLMKVVGLNGPEIVKGPAEIISNKQLLSMGALNDNSFAGAFANGTTGGIGAIHASSMQSPTSNFLQPSTSSTTNVTYNIKAVDAKSFKQLVASDPSFIYAVTMQGARGVVKK